MKNQIIYLTAESDNELDNIESDKYYVIGAMVDHNRYKGYTHELATKLEYKTAKLPILKYMKYTEGPKRLVITVNQVFAILAAYWSWKDWRKALAFAIPPRKGLILIDPLTDEEQKCLNFDGHVVWKILDENKNEENEIETNDKNTKNEMEVNVNTDVMEKKED